MPSPHLQLNDIHFAYPGASPILRGLSLTLSSGDRIGVSGPIGSGKTTLLMIAMGFVRPVAGTVTAFGHSCHREEDFRDVRSRIGLLFQDPDDQLFCPTVEEELVFGPLNLGKSRAEAAAVATRCLSQVGLESLLQRPTWQLSGGEKRLISLAAVLSMQPTALLLDEPTNGLDQSARQRVLEVLEGLPQAMLVISHEEETLARLTDQRLELVDGRTRRIEA